VRWRATEPQPRNRWAVKVGVVLAPGKIVLVRRGARDKGSTKDCALRAVRPAAISNVLHLNPDSVMVGEIQLPRIAT